MVPLAAKAFALSAALLVLMLPTFNALNVAEFSGEPPIRFEPPEDQPPPDDFEGEVSEGENEFDVPPPAGGAEGRCARNVPRDHPGEVGRFGLSPASALGQSGTVTLTVPESAVAVSLAVRFQDDWRGTLDVEWEDPFGNTGEEAFEGGAGGRSNEEARPLGEAAPGEWSAEWRATSYTGRGQLALVYHTLDCAGPSGNATREAP